VAAGPSGSLLARFRARANGHADHGHFHHPRPVHGAAQDLATVVGSGSVNVEWRWLPAIESLQPGRADALRAAIATIGDRAQVAYPATYIWADSGLPDTLKAASRSLLVAQGSILLLFAQFAVLAVYAMLLVAGMLVERRRPESALLRSRGASSGHVALLAFGESLLLAVPAVAVAPFVAVAVVRLVGAVGPLASAGVLTSVSIDGTAVAAAVGAGIGCVLVLTVPALPGLGSGTLPGVRAALSRQLGRTLAQRLGLDLVLLVVAAIAIWQLQLYGAPLTRTSAAISESTRCSLLRPRSGCWRERSSQRASCRASARSASACWVAARVCWRPIWLARSAGGRFATPGWRCC